MKIIYAGPRPSISHTGIFYETHRPDKFIYFQDVFHLFVLLEEATSNAQPLIFTKAHSKASAKEIMAWVHLHHEEIEKEVESELFDYKQHLKEQEQEVFTRKRLNDDEKQAFYKNLTMMHDYRMQRATNKILYWRMIETICDLIVDKGIHQFVFPFSPSTFHIAQAIENHIAARRLPLRSMLYVKENANGNPLVYLILEKI